MSRYDIAGGVVAITDELGLVAERLSFDAWGKRRAATRADLDALLVSDPYNMSLSALSLTSSITDRGFTGHQQLDGVEIIHMGGRIYDATLGRFLQADPFVQDQRNSQSLNRYSYVQNNPLSYTDPSGYFLKKLFKKIGRFIKKVFHTIRRAVQGVFKAIGRVLSAVPGLSTVVAAFVCNVNAACWAMYAKVMTGINAAVTVANGGTLGDALVGVAVGIVSGELAGALGGAIGGAIGKGAVAATIGNFTGSALVSGISAKASGGKFIDGVKGAAIGLAVGFVVNKIGNWVHQAGEKKAGDGRVASPEGSESQSNEAGAREAVNKAYEDGSLDTSKVFESRDAAAKAALNVIHPISEANNIELGGLIHASGDGFSYGEIMFGDASSLNVGPVGNAVAGFHTHPGGADHSYFSSRYNSASGGLGDVGWVKKNKIPLYMSYGREGGGIGFKACRPNSAACSTATRTRLSRRGSSI